MRELPIRLTGRTSPRIGSWDASWREMISRTFVKPNGSSALVYWKPENLLTATLESTVTIQCANVPGMPRLIDLLDGAVYEIPGSIVKAGRNGVVTFDNIPVKDSPLLLTFGDFAEY